MDFRSKLALAFGKLTLKINRLTGSGGTAAPGLIAQKIDPQILSKLANHLSFGAIIVTGTNGKTTTSRILSGILKEAGFSLIHNRTGSNLIRGIVSTLIQASDSVGNLPADLGLFEVDEFTLPLALTQIQPKVVVITNLFRDQLDRYGEIDTIKKHWKEALQQLPAESIVILNGDDPSVAHLGQNLKCKVLYFGLEDKTTALTVKYHATDSTRCQDCGNDLDYEVYFISHLGKYHCPKCNLSRPNPQIFAREIKLESTIGSDFLVNQPETAFNIHLNVPGLYNVYNALAAISVAYSLKIRQNKIEEGLKNFKSAFGRIEQIQIGEKSILLTLVKNPVGFNEILRMIFSEGTKRNVMICINDLFADGRDVSWLWDVDFELMKNKTDHLTISGLRAEDMAVRIKYAEIGEENLKVVKNLPEAIKTALDSTPKDKTLYVLPTYTAMLEIRKTLNKFGYVGQFWEE
ncbi:MAG: Mur ligase family protein [Patescibacteria group bacterium]|nr:Mur ligase family protein [Patescibacteria group bacterium]